MGTAPVMTRYKRSTRRTLKSHLDGQWIRGYSGPHKERHKKVSALVSRGAGKRWREYYQPEPVTATVGDVIADSIFLPAIEEDV